jgi:hypothetical protein
MRGYQKKVIYLKNMESDLFEEAYFVIKDSLEGSNGSTESLVDEANRIIKENIKEKIRRNGASENSRIILFIIAPLFATLFFALGAIFF